jgi:NAD(P)-dependent dehydrogenase (short-subunit alcohol dehydrogenase family)
MRFGGKTALVTGAAGGIGAAVCARLASEGAAVAILDRDAVGAQGLAHRLAAQTGAATAAFPLDVADAAALREAYDSAEDTLGRVDFVVTVAGAMIYEKLEDVSPEAWRTLMSVNFFAAAYLTSLAFARMSPGAALVYVSSIHADQTSPLVGPYAAAKAALTSLARTAAIEGRFKRIRANCILPGAIDTPMLRASPNIKSGAEKLDPEDVGRPEDIAAATAFLLSDEAQFITGESLRVDGGRLAKL